MFGEIVIHGEDFWDSAKAVQFGEEYFERPEAWEHVKKWGTPQRDDYDFKAWTRGASTELLRAGCIYEYARESNRLRCLLVSMRDAAQKRSQHEYSAFDFLRAIAITGLGGNVFDWLSRFVDQLADNTSFRELLSTRRADVERPPVEDGRLWPEGAITPAIRIGELSKIAPWPWDWRPSPGTKLKYPFALGENMGLLGERRILDGGRENFAIQIHWGDSTNKEIGDAMRRFAVNHRPKRKDCKEPSRGGKGPRETLLSNLNALAVRRIWKRERDPWERMHLIAETCRYANCRRDWAAYKTQCKEGRAPDSMDGKAKTEMSRARTRAREVFEILFHHLDGQPANFGLKNKERKLTRTSGGV